MQLSFLVFGEQKGGLICFCFALFSLLFVRNTPSERREDIALQQRLGGREALLHVGQTWHSAEALTSGERYNLIIWARSFSSKQSPTERFVCKCADDIDPALCQVPVVRDSDLDPKQNEYIDETLAFLASKTPPSSKAEL